VPSETETLALHLVRALYDATDGRPQEWRMLEELDRATTDALIFSHPGFRIRLCDGKRAIGAALKATIDAVQNER
jgi:hypothetical protein